jgi:hypothetical protein
MDADHIVKLVEALAWPGTAIILAFLFRTQVTSLINRISAVEAGGVKAAFRGELSEVREIQERSGESDSPRMFDSKASRLQKLADLSPNGAVVDAWREVELAAILAALTAGVKVTGGQGRVSGNAAMQALREKDVLPESMVILFMKLRELRNKAAHSPDTIEASDAKEYVLAAIELAAKFRELPNQPASQKPPD